MSSAGASAAAAAAAVANATKASGAIVWLSPEDFAQILNRSEDPLVVKAPAGFLGSSYGYLTSYKGLFFYCKSSDELPLPSEVELIPCQKIWIPG